MTNKEASFMLAACRPNGADSTDPEFAEALKQAGADPLLRTWLENERRFDSTVAKRVQAIPVPADLRSRIMAGARVSRPATSVFTKRLWAMAAMILLLGGAGIWFAMESWRQTHGWQDQALAGLTELISQKARFDATSGDLPRLVTWLRANGSPTAAAMPPGLQRLTSLGCKQVWWNGHPISLICFHAPDGELVHLAMMDGAAIPNPPPEGRPVFETRDGWQLASWSQNGTAMMLATLGPERELHDLLGAAPAAKDQKRIAFADVLGRTPLF